MIAVGVYPAHQEICTIDAVVQVPGAGEFIVTDRIRLFGTNKHSIDASE